MIKIESDIYGSTFNIDAAQTIYKLFAKKVLKNLNCKNAYKIITTISLKWNTYRRR